MSFTYYGPNPAGHDQQSFPRDTEPPGGQSGSVPSDLRRHTEPFGQPSLPSLVESSGDSLRNRDIAPRQGEHSFCKDAPKLCDSAEWPQHPSVLSQALPAEEEARTSWSAYSQRPTYQPEPHSFAVSGSSWSSIPPPLWRPATSAGGKRGMDTIPNLLGPGREEAMKDITLRLWVRQQPQAARACGFGDRDRRVIDPPPIIQLIVESPTLTQREIRTYLRYESYVLNCTIYDESGTQEVSLMADDNQNQRRLMGSLVGTPFFGQDDQEVYGCFFCFSDLSCRTPGAYRLKFTLLMIDPSRAGSVRHFPAIADAMTEPFHVYSAKEFPGMLPSSRLAKRLKEQGCIISIKKGNDRIKNARSQGDLSGDGADGDDGENQDGQRKRRIVKNEQ